MRAKAEIHLTRSQRATLQQWSRGRKIAVRQAQRAEIILQAAEGKSNQEIAAQLGVKVHTVGRWRNRFAELGIVGIVGVIAKDLPRGGRSRQPESES
jgi:putative transposase